MKAKNTASAQIPIGIKVRKNFLQPYVKYYVNVTHPLNFGNNLLILVTLW